MQIQNLKNEYELRYRIMRYKKYHKLYCYNRFEYHNVENMMFAAEQLHVEHEQKNSLKIH